MLRRIKRFSVAQTAKMLGVLYAIMGLLFIPFFLVFDAFAPEGERLGIAIMLVMPVLYGLLGFVFTAIACALYNAVAGRVGGIEVEVSEAEPGTTG